MQTPTLEDLKYVEDTRNTSYKYQKVINIETLLLIQAFLRNKPSLEAISKFHKAREKRLLSNN